MSAVTCKMFVAMCEMLATRFNMSKTGCKTLAKTFPVGCKTLENTFPAGSRALMTNYTRPIVRCSVKLHSEGSHRFTGDQLRDKLLRWLSPPNPSTNHNLTCKAHYNGTAQWFFQGSIFNQWKSADSFLWVHGKRVLLLTFAIRRPLTISHFIAGSGKSVLWFVLLRLFRHCPSNTLFSAPQS